MTTRFVANFINRNIDKISPFELDRNDSRCDVLFTVSGRIGSGKTTYINRSLKQIAGNAPIIVIDRLNSLLGYGDLLSIITRECEGQVKLSKLQFLINTIQRINQLGLFEFVSRRSNPSNLNPDIISDAFIKDFSICQNIWIVLDHYSSNDKLILDWLRQLLSKKRNFLLRIVHIENFKNINHQEFDLPNRWINIPLFSSEQCEEFYTKSVNRRNVLGLLNSQSAKYIANNSPLWLQWLAHCPSDWMKIDKDAKILDETILSFISFENQKNFLGQIATSSFLNKTILDEMTKKNKVFGGGWLLSPTLRECPDDANVVIHHSIKNRIRQDILLGEAPSSEDEYHRVLYEIYKPISQAWIMGEDKDASPEVLEIVKALFYHKNRFEITGNVDEVKSALIYKCIMRNLGLIGDLVKGSFDEPTAGLRDFYVHLINRRFREARDGWERFYLASNFLSKNNKSSCLAILGFLLFLEDRDDEAKNSFADSISLNKNCSLAYLGRGLLFQSLQQNQEAINDLTEAIKLDSQLSLAYNERGVLYQSQGKAEQAVHDFQMALSTQPDNIHAMINLSILLIQMGNKTESLNWLSQAMRIDGVEAKSYISLIKSRIDSRTLLN